jgi:hypothetical protein
MVNIAPNKMGMTGGWFIILLTTLFFIWQRADISNCTLRNSDEYRDAVSRLYTLTAILHAFPLKQTQRTSVHRAVWLLD